MSSAPNAVIRLWTRVGTRFLPFADAATPELPLGRLLRLALFQVSVGMALVLLNGTLNRVMIVELDVSAWVVSLMVALPIVFAPLRALVGFRSDMHLSALGWRRVPYIWMGTMMQFGGLAIMPFALLVLTGQGEGPAWVGHLGAVAAFLMVGAGVHTTQTAGLALATDLASDEKRPRVIALMYVMLLAGMVAASLTFGRVLAEFTPVRLIQVIQGCAAATMALNCVALWKQEGRNRRLARAPQPQVDFRTTWRALVGQRHALRTLVVVGLGSAAFSMQDVLLEPFGGQILHLSVGATTLLTALMAGGSLVAFALSARWLQRGVHPSRLAAHGALLGVFAFAAVVFAEPLGSAALFRTGVALIGFASGLFSVATLSMAMDLRVSLPAQTDPDGRIGHGLALGAWGAVQATASGGAIALGGALRDVVSSLATQGLLGSALQNPATGYSVVYHLEIGLLFATLVAIGPLVRSGQAGRASARPFGLAEFPS